MKRLVVATVASIAMLAVMAPSAFAWDARTTEGTAAERANTSTPLPSGGDQCSNSPDSAVGFYDFSWACYAHDVCYQNHSLNGVGRSRASCDQIFKDKMYAECNYRHDWWSPARYACHDVADTYYAFVRAFGYWAYQSWSDPNTG